MVTETITRFEVGEVLAFGEGGSRLGRTIVTAVDRVKGTITMASHPFLTFDALLKAHYSPARIRKIASEEYITLRRSEMRDFQRIMEGADDADMVEPPAFIPLPAITALATIAGLEWLRRRKNDIAEADRNGTAASLMEEFYTWLRVVIRAWIAAAMGKETPDAA